MSGTRSASRRTSAGALVGLAVLGAAAADQLRRPAGERTWTGRLAGVPYDLRPPSISRLRAAWWNPDDPRWLTPRPLGVGWAVNLGRLAR